jgi:hypothetical protein
MKAKSLNQILKQNDEEANIKKARHHWKIVRSKRLIIKMIARLGEGMIMELD